jgi:pimeloyl-ACP methyl ester carboxylesterase
MNSAAVPVHRTEHVIEGCAISVMRGGAGSPLLFLHGSDAFTAWLPFMEALAGNFDVIVPDHPGFGRSDTPAWLDSIGDLAHAYRAFIDALGLRDVVIAGHGLGGWIACELALRNPRDVRALVLVDSAGLPLVKDGIDAFMCSPDELRRASYLDERRAPPLDDDARSQIAKNMLMTARMGWQPRFYDPQLAKWLHRITLPALIVWGAEDAIFPAAQAHAFAGAIAGSRVAIIPGAGHLPHIEAPQAFTTAVAGFLAGVRP